MSTDNNIIEQQLNITYTVEVTARQGLRWKRGVRITQDNTNSLAVYTYLINESSRSNNIGLLNALTSDRESALTCITNWFATKTTEAQNQVQAAEFNINEYIIRQFNDNFFIDDVTLLIHLKTDIGKVTKASSEIAEIIMSIADHELNIHTIGIERVRRCVGHLLRIMHENKRKEHLTKIKFNKNRPKYVDGWITKLFDLYGIDNNELNLTMFKHMLYSIKRSVFGLPPADRRFMYSFYSRKQGIGKSRFVAHLCDPFPFLFSDQGTIDKLIKKNDLKALISNRCVIDIQELASEGEFDHSSYAAMKAAITSESVGGRVLYTTSNEDVQNYAVFLSSTNLHIADVIRDDTGLRRFYSFDFTKDHTGMDWDVVDAHWKYIHELYTYIDEEGPAPLTDKMVIFGELEQVQENYQRRTDFILEWQSMSGNTILVHKSKKSNEISKTELFTLMRDYCKSYESFNLKMGTMKSLLISRHNIFPHKDKDGCDAYHMESIVNSKPMNSTTGLPENEWLNIGQGLL